MKIWFYYAKSGGGHKAPAEALAREMQKLYPEGNVKLVDLAEKAELFFKYAIEDGYVSLTQRLPWLYAALYIVNAWRPVVKIENRIIDFFVKPSIKAKLVLDCPDGIVATHFFVSPLLTAMRELKLSIPLIIIVTEPFSTPEPWFYYPNIQYVVFSEEAKAVALKEGVAESNVAVFKPIINHPIVALDDGRVLVIRNKYGLTPGKKIVLIIGGANGLPKGDKILSALLKDSIDAEFVVVCGNNKKSEDQMRALAARYPKKAVVMGYVKDVGELIAVADLVIGKAGAGVVFETLMNKKPLLITHYIYGQEKGTMEFVVKRNLGWYEPRPSRIAEKVKQCLSPKELGQVAAAQEAFQLAPGNRDVVNYLFRSLSGRRA